MSEQGAHSHRCTQHKGPSCSGMGVVTRTDLKEKAEPLIGKTRTI